MAAHYAVLDCGFNTIVTFAIVLPRLIASMPSSRIVLHFTGAVAMKINWAEHVAAHLASSQSVVEYCAKVGRDIA